MFYARYTTALLLLTTFALFSADTTSAIPTFAMATVCTVDTTDGPHAVFNHGAASVAITDPLNLSVRPGQLACVRADDQVYQIRCDWEDPTQPHAARLEMLQQFWVWNEARYPADMCGGRVWNGTVADSRASTDA